MDEIIIVLGIFIAPVSAIYLVIRYKIRRLQILHDIARSNVVLTPQIVSLFRRPTFRSAVVDYRRGTFCIAVGLALAAILGLEAFENSRKLALVALLPIFLGIGYFVTARFASDRPHDVDQGDQA